MKRKRPPVSGTSPEAIAPQPLIPEALIDDARKMLEAGRAEKPKPCVVCGEQCAPNSTEGLCWVCRRLKLSAWRDADTQMPAQE